MEQGGVVIPLSPQEILRLEMIAVDIDKDDALSSAKDLRRWAQVLMNKGMKSHLDT